MTWMPFACLGVGLILSLKNLSRGFLKVIDIITNVTLVILMLTIGANIGVNNSVISNLDSIGIHCVVISLIAIFFSVIATLVIEKTILPLDEVSKKLYVEKMSINDEVNISEEENKKTSPLIWIMPISIIMGVICGYFVMTQDRAFILEYLLMGSLVVLYTCVGTSLGC